LNSIEMKRFIKTAIMGMVFLLAVLAGAALFTGYFKAARLPDPLPKQLEIGARSPIGLQFAQPMDRQSVEQHIALEPAFVATPVWNDNQLWLLPVQPLQPGQTITLKLNAGSKTASGSTLRSGAEWSFRVRGSRLVYLGGALSQPELWLTGSDGGTATQLTHSGGMVVDFAPSPGGEWLLVSQKNSLGGQDLWKLSIADGAVESYANCGAAICSQAAVSPTGLWVAYTRQEPRTPPQVWLVSSAGDTQLVDTSNGSAGHTPTWSPDGQRLAFYDLRLKGLRVISLVGGQAIELPTPDETGVAWVPDGSALLFLNNQLSEEAWQLHVFRADFESGSVQPAWNRAPGEPELGLPAISPDGRLLAAPVRSQGGSAGQQIWLFDAQGSAMEAISADLTATHSNMRWSPDGEALAFQRLQLGSSNASPEILVWNRTSRKLTVVAQNAARAQWLP